ncbi:OmpA family protein [Streptomyces griseorubiginosus]|uniref:OmpA family protein n=1 Tax=Streptomyces griseorubiginosus TaxID=67304 RepID=UPI001AD6BA63|nr:OmpA family protein [Streptomyces griseorubiginosus]MBO4259506.1 OmpA family protein [Streptomyces griseorubiginosus]
MTTLRTRPTTPLLPVVLAAAASIGAACWAGQAAAAGGPSAAPGSPLLSAGAPDRPGLALRDGARLAPAKVLDLASQPADITRVVANQDTAERRETTGTQVTVVLQAAVLFPKDSARLSTSARSRITALARQIQPRAGTTIRVYGYTDNLGTAAHGHTLSQQRATAVQTVLATELRGTPVVFDTRGFGESHPAAPNTTEAGRRNNRRVEISYPRPDD